MKKLWIVIVLTIVIIASILGGIIMYKVHEENVLNEKTDSIISSFDEEYDDTEYYQGTRYDKEKNIFIVRFKSDIETTYISKDTFDSLIKDSLKEKCNIEKQRIKDDFEFDCDVKLSYDYNEAISD